MSYTAASVMQCCHGAIMSDTMSTVLCYAATTSFNAAGVRDYIATIFERFRSIVATVTALLHIKLLLSGTASTFIKYDHWDMGSSQKRSTFQSNTCVM